MPQYPIIQNERVLLTFAAVGSPSASLEAAAAAEVADRAGMSTLRKREKNSSSQPKKTSLSS